MFCTSKKLVKQTEKHDEDERSRGSDIDDDSTVSRRSSRRSTRSSRSNRVDDKMDDILSALSPFQSSIRQEVSSITMSIQDIQQHQQTQDGVLSAFHKRLDEVSSSSHQATSRLQEQVDALQKRLDDPMLGEGSLDPPRRKRRSWSPALRVGNARQDTEARAPPRPRLILSGFPEPYDLAEFKKQFAELFPGYEGAKISIKQLFSASCRVEFSSMAETRRFREHVFTTKPVYREKAVYANWVLSQEESRKAFLASTAKTYFLPKHADIATRLRLCSRTNTSFFDRKHWYGSMMIVLSRKGAYGQKPGVRMSSHNIFQKRREGNRPPIAWRTIPARLRKPYLSFGFSPGCQTCEYHVLLGGTQPPYLQLIRGSLFSAMAVRTLSSLTESMALRGCPLSECRGWNPPACAGDFPHTSTFIQSHLAGAHRRLCVCDLRGKSFHYIFAHVTESRAYTLGRG